MKKHINKHISTVLEHIFQVCCLTGLLLSAASCTDELVSGQRETAQPAKGSVRVTIDSRPSFNMTRAKMVDSPGTGISVEWTGGDQIGIFSTAGSNMAYTLATAENGTIGTFQGEGGTPTGSFAAYYPYDASATGTTAGDFTLSMPATQKYTKKNMVLFPDPTAGTMAGTGIDGNVTLRSVHAILKIGYVSKAATDEVTSISFRDLSGKPVSGRYSVKVVDDIPEATFPDAPVQAEDGVLTLDCHGEGGVMSLGVSYFYLIVPARNYSQGFELTFHLKSGNDEVRTIGKTVGKRLERAMLYPVGDVSVIREDSYTMEFNGVGMLMSEEQLSMVEGIWQIDGEYSTPQANYFEDLNESVNKIASTGPTKYGMAVDNRLKIEEGMTIVINRPSEALPYGLVARVVRVDKQNDRLNYVELQRYAHIEGAFKKLKIGSTRYDANGNPIDGEGVSLNMAGAALATEDPYLDSQDDVPYDSVTTFIGDSIDVYADNMTRAHFRGSDSYTMPRICKQVWDRNNRKLFFGAQPGIETYLDIDIEDGQLNHLFARLTPFCKFDVTAMWEFKKEIDNVAGYDLNWPLARVMFGTIVVGPVVFVPEIRGSLGLSLAASLTLQAQWSYKAAFQVDMIIQRSYKSSDSFFNWSGVTYEDSWSASVTNKSDPVNMSRMLPKLSAEGELSVTGHIYLDAGFSVYGLVSFGVFVDPNMKLGVKVRLDDFGWDSGIALTPGVSVGSYVGNLRKHYDAIGLEFDPLWECSFIPRFKLEDHVTWSIPHAYRQGDRIIKLGRYLTGTVDTGRPYVQDSEYKIHEEDKIPVSVGYYLQNKTLTPIPMRWYCYKGDYPYEFVDYYDAMVYQSDIEQYNSNLEISPEDMGAVVPSDLYSNIDGIINTGQFTYLKLQAKLGKAWITVSSYMPHEHDAVIRVELYWSPKEEEKEYYLDIYGDRQTITKTYRTLNARILDHRDEWNYR